MERELKLRVSAGNAKRLRKSPVLARFHTNSAHTEELTSTYFDSPDLAFHRCGASLRVRAIGDERLQTLKLDGSVKAGLVLAGPTLDNAFDSVADDKDAVSVRRAAKEVATKHRSVAASAVDSVRYTRLVLELTRWVETSGWRNGLDDEARQALNKPVRKFASQMLCRRHEKLIKRGRGLAELDDDSRHRARIAAKKLRYTTEFFASLYAKRSVGHYTGALGELQDDLGWRNDMVVADGLLKSLPVSRPETAAGAGFARGYLASCVAADHDALKMLWKRFKRVSPPISGP